MFNVTNFLLSFLLLFVAGCSSASFVYENSVPADVASGEAAVFPVSREREVRILSFGDLMLDRNVKKQIDENSEDYLLSGLLGENNNFFSSPDITAANLEGPFADYRRQTNKEIAFQFDKKLIAMLGKYGFDLLDIANNHSLDMGQAGLAELKTNLTRAGIEFYGDGYGISDAAMLIKNINGFNVAFLGFNDTYYSLPEKKIVELVESAATSSDFVVVNIHWGEEYKFLQSNARQQKLAHVMIDAGADVIIGHHPHVIQEIEIYKERPIFYSLGNFIFDQYFSVETQQGMGVGLTLSKGKLTVRVFLLQGENSRVRLMDPDKADMLWREVVAKSRLGGYNFDDFVYVNRYPLSSPIPSI